MDALDALPVAHAAERDLKAAGQRRINIIWEVTQGIIALAVSFTTLYVTGILTLRQDAKESAFILLSNAFFLIIGFYFGRTNHARTGGVGGELAGPR